ncbi:MAG: ECF transporter S component [Lachnospiraceae bacterium]|nr:ECF transporter S component [Lachnospiraceae bacterium]
MNKNLLKVVYSALLAALACVATMIIRIPSVGSVGYVNIGDTIVLISAWLLGGVYGGLAAGIGTALADLLAGYAYYVPGTFIIKFLMAFIAFLIFKTVKKEIIGLLLSGLVAELIMIVGYFFYKALILGKGFEAAIPSVFSNIAQGVTSLAIGIILYYALEKAKFNNAFRSSLNK